jgi:pimeloyl-ACP methyl ester carboxylesterase
MRERAVTFGQQVELAGVLGEPGRAAVQREWPAVVFLNSGLLHKVGASRLYVRVARDLAAAGFTTLRFDLSGIGDSDPRRDAKTYEESAVADVREAMDYLGSSFGTREFVLFGLCSGSDMAFEVAKVDNRVIGLVQLDAYAYRTWRWYVNYYGPRLGRARSWSGYMKRQAKSAFGVADGAGDESDVVVSPYAREFPPREQVGEGLRQLTARGVWFLNVFSGGQLEHYNYARQHEDTFADVDFGGRLQVEYIAAADHVFTGLDHQQLVVRATREWLLRWVPARNQPNIAAAS